MNKYILSILLVLPYSGLVIAQENTDVPVVEEIIVTGIKDSLQNAIDIKRSNVGVMDAITAEDFGKFPDGNLAESLARVAGVGIDRSNVEGERVAVRGFGPEFNLVTLNGRQMPTVPGQWGGGRSFNFGDIASPGISAVEIYKSTNGSLPSGGIGSTINMVTTRPLNIEGTKRTISFNFVDDTTSEESDYLRADSPIETSFLYGTNQDTWGFSFSGSYQDRNNREEGTREANWISHPQIISTDGYDRLSTATNVTNNSTRTDGVTFYQEPSAYQIKDNDRLRKNVQSTFQLVLSDNVITTFDYTYSGVEFDSQGLMFGSWLGGWDTQSATINSNGAYTDVVVGNRAYDHQLIWGSTKGVNKSLGFNLEWDVSDTLGFSFDFHDSSAALNGSTLPNEMGFTTDKKATITHQNAGASGINTFAYDTTFAPENYLATSVMIRDMYKENDMQQFQVNGTWLNSDGSSLKSVDFGLSTLDNSFDDLRSENSVGAIAPSVADYDDSIFTSTNLGSFMNSFSTNFGTNYYMNIDKDSALNAFVAKNGAVGAGDIDTNERINETLESAFIQFNFETEVMGTMPLNIIAGVRYEQSETESISLENKPSVIRWDMIDGFKYIGNGIVDAPRYGENDVMLPNLAISLGLDDNQVIRFSYSKSMARPSLQDLRSQLSFGNRNYIQATASGGNPNLEPLMSKNFDISYENYYAEGSYFAVNYFNKEISDFIGTQTVYENVDQLTDPSQGAIGSYAVACVNEWVAAGRPQTGFPGEGGTGHCVSQQALWAQGWMNDFQHMGWVAVAMSRGVDVSSGFPWGQCDYGGWWRCEPGYIDGQPGDPLATFEITKPYNKETGTVNGFEIVLQHLFDGTPFGMQLNATVISGGDVDVDRNIIGEQFILPGLGDAGNFSVWYEDLKHTARIALNYRGETVAGFGNYEQPLYVESRTQIDFSYQYRMNEGATLFLDAMNITDESTRLYARHSEMLFLSQDHGPIYKFGFRRNF